MRYQNPVLRGFYPDPSVCRADGMYYLVCSSFQYFPGVPLFESPDLVNWTQIGYVLNRGSQLNLEGAASSGGIFAPTIRYHDGRFYMVTTNACTWKNFYVYTDDIHGPWSDPIEVDQGGIDPSLLFDGPHTYFLSNGGSGDGREGIVQCEIDIRTGRRLTESRVIWQGTGGRYLEAPHMYSVLGWYYLLAAEGGTEYGHMVTCARSRSPWGPFANCPHNPILTNRDKAPDILQGIGHADLIQDWQGGWHLFTLGFRQIHPWQPYHTLGREVFLAPAQFSSDGWLEAGTEGHMEASYEIPGDFPQRRTDCLTFENTDWGVDWCCLRRPVGENYAFAPDRLTLRGTDVSLDDPASPTFLALRQKEFDFELGVEVSLDRGEAGVTAYISETEHYDLCLAASTDGLSALVKLNIGPVKHIQRAVPLTPGPARLILRGTALEYRFSVQRDGQEQCLGSAASKYLSSEVSGGHTGTMLGLYAVGENTAVFRAFSLSYAP